MFTANRLVSALVLCSLLMPLTAMALTEPKTETEYPDAMTVNGQDLVITGVALREKTFLKVDVYVIASYVSSEASFGENKHQELREYTGPKRLVMDLTRGFSAEKLKNAFSEIIDKNYDDKSAFQDDLDALLGYFTEEAKKDDHLVFDYNPAVGLTTTLNGTEKGVITNFEFVKALWSVWFGDTCADKGVRKDLLKNIS